MKRYGLILVGVLTIVFLCSHLPQRVAPSASPVNQTNSADTKVKASVASRRASEPLETNSLEDASEEQAEQEWQPTPEQIEAYLAKYGRTAESLVTAFDVSRDKKYLQEALEKFPNDPFVRFAQTREYILMSDTTTPEERKAILEAFKKVSPDNGLGDCLSALEALKNGQTDVALSEISNALDKSSLSAYYTEMLQSREEFCLIAGLSESEAREKSFGLLMPTESALKTLSRKLSDLQLEYLNSGDPASAAQIAALNISISRGWGNSSGALLLSKLVATGMENAALKNLPQDQYFDFLGKTPAERIKELQALRVERREITSAFNEIEPQLSEQEKSIYFQRVKLYGEEKAMRWLVKTYGQSATK